MSEHIRLSQQFNKRMEEFLTDLDTPGAHVALRKMRNMIGMGQPWVVYQYFITQTSDVLKEMAIGNYEDLEYLVESRHPFVTDWGIDKIWHAADNDRRNDLIDGVYDLAHAALQANQKSRTPTMPELCSAAMSLVTELASSNGMKL